MFHHRVVAFLVGVGLVTALTPAPAPAQGVQTGTLSGTVASSDGAVIPGATVTAKSKSLLGVRTTTTDPRGAYILKGLPSGEYQIEITHDSFATVTQAAVVGVGETVDRPATLPMKSVTETVEVSAVTASQIADTQGGQNLRAEDIDKLAVGRDPVSIAALAPGVSTNTPNNGLSISGGFAYDTQFLLDGVDYADNLQGEATDVFIEDAIEEVQVLTSGISAEYGRFGGGVVNAITKSGGNRFSGTFRTDFTNPSWRALTLFETDNERPKPESDLQAAYQATLGGFIVRDRLWFFAAGRLQKEKTAETLPVTGLPFTQETDDERFEVKLTGNLNPRHTLTGMYSKDVLDSYRPSLTNDIDTASLIRPHQPVDLLVARYNGTPRNDLFLEAQYSRKRQAFQDFGGTSTDLRDSPFLPYSLEGDTYNAPYFDATDPEDRDNHQLTASISHFRSTQGFGRHDLKAGFEHFRSRLTGGNSQSPTDLVFYADYLTDEDGKAVFDNGRLVPLFIPEGTELSFFRATRGTELHITTSSFYVNDRVTAGRFNLNLGLRFESVRSDSSDGRASADADTLVPRLAASWDVKGNGRWRLDASYAQYAGKYNDAQFGGNTNVGNPDEIFGVYVGPEGAGRDDADGFDLNNYVLYGGYFPTANVIFAPGLSSPVTQELTFGVGHAFDRGSVKAVYTQRRVGQFVEDFIELGNGTVDIVENGETLLTLTNAVYRNSDLPQRDYDAVHVLGQYRFGGRFWATATYTLQLQNDGNFEGEGRGTPAITSTLGDFPEILVAARSFPTGRLDDFQRHRLRLYGSYTFDFGRRGTLDVGGLYRYDSARTYSLVALSQPLSDIQLSRDPGYPDLPTTQTLFFGERGSESFHGAHRFDLALHYSVPVRGTIRPYVKAEIVNLLGSQALVAYDTTVDADPDGPVDADGLPTTFVKAPQFGKATSNADYQSPRAVRFALGFRF